MTKKIKKQMVMAVMAVVLGSMTFASCNKELDMIDRGAKGQGLNPDIPLPIADTTWYLNIDSIPVVYNGSLDASMDSCKLDKLLGIVFRDTMFYFDNDTLFIDFCRRYGMGNFYETNKRLDLIYDMAVKMGIENEDYETIDSVPQMMKDYWMKVFGCEFGSVPTEMSSPKLTWASTLYVERDFHGGSKTCVGPTYWSLGSFNNRASSFRVYNTGIGGIWWCHKKWYGKPRVGYFMLGLPLGNVGWSYVGDRNNDKFCSYCTTLH